MIVTTEDYRALQQRVSDLETTVERLVVADIKLRNQCEFLQQLFSFLVAPSRGLQGRDDSFNPSVGILFVWTRSASIHRPAAAQVSIPRSGFCLFGRGKRAWTTIRPIRFNPSVGILFVWTGMWRPGLCGGRSFQSLGRDSVCLEAARIPS